MKSEKKHITEAKRRTPKRTTHPFTLPGSDFEDEFIFIKKDPDSIDPRPLAERILKAKALDEGSKGERAMLQSNLDALLDAITLCAGLSVSVSLLANIKYLAAMQMLQDRHEGQRPCVPEETSRAVAVLRVSDVIQSIVERIEALQDEHVQIASEIERILSDDETSNGLYELLTDALLELSNSSQISAYDAEVAQTFYLAAHKHGGRAQEYVSEIKEILALVAQGETFDDYKYSEHLDGWLSRNRPAA